MVALNSHAHGLFWLQLATSEEVTLAHYYCDVSLEYR